VNRESSDGLEAAEEFGELVAMSLQRVKGEQDPESFETLVQLVHESLDNDMTDVAGLITHALFVVVSGRKPPGDFNHEDILETLTEDLRSPVSPEWQRAEAGRIHYLAGRVAVQLSAWEAAQEFFHRSLVYFSGAETEFDQALTHQAMAGVYSMQDDLEAAMASSLVALNWYQREGDTKRSAEVLLNLSQDSLFKSVEQAGSYLDQAEQLLKSTSDGHLNASLMGLRAMLHVQSSDFEAAEPLLRKAVTSARRRRDQSQEQRFMQNLANVIEESRGPRQALSWRLKALRVAENRQDIHAQATLQRSVAITFARTGRTADALPHLKRAVDLAHDTKDQRLLAESLADLGAMILSHTAGVSLTFDDDDDGDKIAKNSQQDHGVKAPLPSETDTARLNEALRYFNSALAIFLELQDSEWIQRVAMNRRNLLQKQATEQAVQDLLSLSRQVKQFDERLSAELLREAARTECQAGVDPGTALRLYRDAIDARNYDHDSERAWALGEAAAELTGLGGFHEEASILFDEAATIHTRLDDLVSAATAANDRGVALADADHLEEAIAVFKSVAEIAKRQHNRVLMEMAFNNLGQAWSRIGDVGEAIICLSRAAELAADLGDHVASVEHWSQVSGMLVNSDSPGEADRALGRARQQADVDGSDEAKAFLESAEAARAFAGLNFIEAAELWVESSKKTQDKNRLERISFALEANARAGRATEYRQLLGKFTAAAQSSHTRQEASEMLWRPALAWLSVGKPRDAALGLGTAALLSASEILDGQHRIDFSRLQDARRVPNTLRSFYVTLAQVATVLSHDDIPRETRTRCRTMMVQGWRRNQGSELADFLDQQLRETEESLAEKEAP
jgi:tetratricopeptide (TPR) repeat protein